MLDLDKILGDNPPIAPLPSKVTKTVRFSETIKICKAGIYKRNNPYYSKKISDNNEKASANILNILANYNNEFDKYSDISQIPDSYEEIRNLAEKLYEFEYNKFLEKSYESLVQEINSEDIDIILELIRDLNCAQQKLIIFKDNLSEEEQEQIDLQIIEYLLELATMYIKCGMAGMLTDLLSSNREKVKTYIDLSNSDGEYLITEAAKQNSYECLKVLLEHGADSNLQEDSYNKTPLHYACENENKKTIELLKQTGANSDIKDSSGTSPLDIIQSKLRHGSIKLIKKDLKALETYLLDKPIQQLPPAKRPRVL